MRDKGTIKRAKSQINLGISECEYLRPQVKVRLSERNIKETIKRAQKKFVFMPSVSFFDL